MPRSRKLTPSYLPHKQSGRGRAVWTDAAGVRHEQLLPGPFDSRASPRSTPGAGGPAATPARCGSARRIGRSSPSG